MLELLGKVPVVHTVTLDNGGEFADHARVAKGTGAKVYFAKPYASWQRGTNENTNGRIRRFWPKKFDMATLTDEQIDDNILLLNLTPRKVLGGLTPLESLYWQACCTYYLNPAFILFPFFCFSFLKTSPLPVYHSVVQKI